MPEQAERWLVVRLPVADMLERLDLPVATRASVLMDRYLTPSLAEISEITDFDVTARAIKTVYRGPVGGRKSRAEGKVRAIEIRIAIPEAEPVRVMPGRVRGRGWQRKPLPEMVGTRKRPEAAPAPMDNVVPVPNSIPAFASNANESARTILDPSAYGEDEDWAPF